MKTRFKRMFTTLAMVLAILGLTGCHGSKGLEAFEVPESFDTSRNYEITFWAKNDTNKTQTDIYYKAIADFEALYPNIKVNMRLYTNYQDIYNDVITNIATQTTPNVCITYPDHIATYLSGINVVVPLDTIMEDSKYGLGGSEVRFDAVTREEIVPQFLAECRIQDTCYALPYMRSTEACYVNKTYVEKLGYELPEVLTWDFVFEVAEAAMAKDADGNYLVNGQNILIPFLYKSTDNMMIQMLKQLNGGYSDADGNILIYNETTRALIREIASHGETKAFSTFKISSYPANFLNAGQCIFAVDSTAGATWMGSNAPLIDIAEDKLVEFETEVMMIPQYDPENPQMISQGPSVCIFNKEDNQQVLASWLFAQYLLTNDVQIAYAETEGYLPVTTKAQQSEVYTDYLSREGEDNETYYEVKIQASKLLQEHTEDTFVTPVFNGSASLREAAGQLIEMSVKDVRRKQEITDEYIDKLFDNITGLYHLNKSNSGAQNREDFGPLPSTAVWMLVLLGITWCGILFYLGISFYKKNRKKD